MFPSSWRRFLNTRSPKSWGRSRKDQRTTRPKPNRRLLLEPLEDRLALTVSASVNANHLLTVSLGATNDSAIVRGDVASTTFVGDTVTVSGTGLAPTTFANGQAINVSDGGSNANQFVSFTSLNTNTFDISNVGFGTIAVTGLE